LLPLFIGWIVLQNPKAMASILNAQAVENIIGYKFQHGHDQLRKALTAAGVLDEDWDGNRKLAQFGTALSEFILTYLAFEAEATRGETPSACDTKEG
jgi:hypothetical protein